MSNDQKDRADFAVWVMKHYGYSAYDSAFVVWQAVRALSAARIEELEKKLAEQQALLMEVAVSGIVEICELRDALAVVNRKLTVANLELSAARAEERAKVMKEVSETPAVAKVVSSGPLANLQCLEWVSANASLSTTMGDELIVRPTFKE